MRRAIGLILTGLGAFLVAMAALMRFYLAGEVIKFPLNEHVVATLAGHDVSYFSQKQVTEVSGASVLVTQTIEGDVAAGSASTAVWEEFTSVRDVTNSRSVLTTVQRSAFNRHTGALVDCCGEFVGGDTSVRQSGQGYVWPIGTQKRSYQVFDPDTLRPEPFRYEGTATVDGLATYKFAEHVSNQQIGSQKVPGWLIGLPRRTSVTLTENITEASTIWVDPVTGIPVDESQTLDRSLQDAGVPELVLFDGTVSETSQSIASAIGTAGSYHVRVDLLETAGPLTAVLLGLVLAGLGVAFTRWQPAGPGGSPNRELDHRRGQLAGVRPSLPAGQGAVPWPWPQPAQPDRNRDWTGPGPWDMIGTTQKSEHQAGTGYWPGPEPRPAAQARQEPGPWQNPGPAERWGDGARRVLEPGDAEPRLDRGSRGGRHRAPRR
jgi:hypothetical protein